MRKAIKEILEGILLPVLVCASKRQKIKPADIKIDSKLCILINEKYMKMRNQFHKKYMNDEHDRIDRHKISGIFYVAIVEAAKERKFVDFRNVPRDKKRLFVHNLAFNTAMGILESFIISDKKRDGEYRMHIETNGIITQLDKYKEYTIKEFALAQKYGKLSPFLLANIFYLIERNSEDKFHNVI